MVPELHDRSRLPLPGAMRETPEPATEPRRPLLLVQTGSEPGDGSGYRSSTRTTCCLWPSRAPTSLASQPCPALAVGADPTDAAVDPVESASGRECPDGDGAAVHRLNINAPFQRRTPELMDPGGRTEASGRGDRANAHPSSRPRRIELWLQADANRSHYVAITPVPSSPRFHGERGQPRTPASPPAS